jgi:glycosyltransferase involved in cell wall biosynthesis
VTDAPAQRLTDASPPGTTGVPDRLRIAFVYDALVPYLSGGAERRFHELATRLATRHEVHYVTWRFWGPEPTIVRDGVTLHGVGAPRDFYGADGKRTIREAAEFAVRLVPVLRRLDVDVVDASTLPYLPLYGAWLATRLSGTPLVATWHEFWGEHWAGYLPERPLVARIARLLEAGARRLGERPVAVSQFTARRMFGVTPPRPVDDIDVVGNGVDVARIRSAAPDPVRSDVIYVGRLIDEKRVDLILHATAALRDRFPATRVAIAGEGPEGDRLRALAAELGVADQVAFLGRVPDGRIPGLLKASRILALPSIREGFGIVVVEAQAAGLVPVVARSPHSAAADLVLDGRNGVLFEPTAASLADALARLLGDEPMLEALAAGARKSADRHGWDDRTMEMERIYGQVARAARPRRSGRARPVRPTAARGPG